MREKSIYFVRHGESEWNVANRICGATDIPLTQRGHEQAIETGTEILREGIRADEILYSPLLRAADTAKHISEMTGIPAREEPRLIEQNFGVWEGTSPRNAPDFRAAKRQFMNHYGTGESMFRLAQRIYNLLDDLAKDEKTYILVAHNGISRVVKSYFEDMSNEEYADFGVPNCSVTEWKFKKREPENLAHSLVKLTDHVYIYPQDPDLDRPNLGYIKTPDLCTAIDAGHSQAHIREFYEALTGRGEKLPDLTALTHWHWDHTYAMAFAHGLTVAERRTNEYLSEISKRDMAEYKLEITHMDPYVAAEYQNQEMKVVPADLVYDEKLDLDLGEVTVKLFHIPSPHTDDGVAALVEPDGVLFLGDSVSGPYPTYEATAEDREDLRDVLRGIAFETAVNSHCEPMSREELFKWLEE